MALSPEVDETVGAILNAVDGKPQNVACEALAVALGFAIAGSEHHVRLRIAIQHFCRIVSKSADTFSKNPPKAN